MISKVSQYEGNKPSEAEIDAIFDELTDLLFDMWNVDIKQNENPNTQLCN